MNTNSIIASEMDVIDEDKEIAEAVLEGEADIAAGRTISAEEFWRELKEEYDL